MNHLPSLINDKKFPFTSFLRLTPILAIIALISGCGTMTALTNDHYTPEQAIAYESITYADFHNPPLIYGGVITDANFLKHVHPGNIWPIIELGFPVVDAGFSFVADTLLLPYTAYQQLFTNNDFQKAAGAGDLDKVKKLLDAGQDINAKDIYGHTALMNAAWEGQTEVVLYLIDKGAALNKQHKFSEATALTYAVARKFDDPNKNNSTIIKPLSAGASVNKDKIIRDSLVLAVEHMDIASLKVLLDTDIDKSNFLPALHSAIRLHDREGRDNKPIIKILLEAGAPVDFYCLQNSIREKDVTIADMLIEHGADPNITGYCGTSLLLQGTHNLTYWIGKGANVNATRHVSTDCPSYFKEDEGMTPLMQAGKDGDIESVTILINAGADVNSITPNGNTALTFAASNEHVSKEKQTEIINLLKKAGATR